DLVAQLDQGRAMQALAARVNAVVGETDNLITQLSGLSDVLRPGAGRGVTQQGDASSAAYSAAQAALVKLRDFRDQELARPLAGLGYRPDPGLREEGEALSGLGGRGESRAADSES